MGNGQVTAGQNLRYPQARHLQLDLIATESKCCPVPGGCDREIADHQDFGESVLPEVLIFSEPFRTHSACSDSDPVPLGT